MNEDPNDEFRDPDRLFWAEYIERYKEAKASGERSIWERADIASEVDTTYGGGELMRFSYNVTESFSTLITYRWVARAYPKEDRVEGLSFRHHQVVANRPDRLEWLKKALENRWSVAVLQAEMRPINNIGKQERAIDLLSKPKHPSEYTLRELSLLELEERHRIMSLANWQTEEIWDNNPGETFPAVSPEEALAVLNYQIETNKDALEKMNLLEVINLLFGRVTEVDYIDDKFVVKQ